MTIFIVPGPLGTTPDSKSQINNLFPTLDSTPPHFLPGPICYRDTPLQLSTEPIEAKKKIHVALIVGGATTDNPFGHVAIAIEGHGTYSYGTNTAPGSSLTKYLSQQNKYRYSIVYTMQTYEEQAQLMVNYLLEQFKKPLPNPKKDPKGFVDTCASRTISALNLAGFSNPKPTPFGEGPSIFPRDASNYGRAYGEANKISREKDIPLFYQKFDSK